MNNFDEVKFIDHFAKFTLILVSMALFIGFALGWLAYMVSEAFA